MGRTTAKLVAFICVLCGYLTAAGPAAAAPVIDGTFPVGSEIDSNNKIVAGPDGNVWLTVGGGTNDVAKVTPAGQVEEFDLPEISGTNGIAAGPDGNLWVPTTNKVTRFSPGDPVGSAQSFTVNLINNDGQIITGPDGLLWVASQNSVVHFSTADPEGAQAVALEGELAPKDIEVAGSLIVIADQSGGNRVVTFTTAGTQKDFAIDGPSQGVAGGPGGQIAFSAPLAVPEKAGLISPPNPAQSFELLGDPFGVTFGGDGAYWIVQFAFGQLARVTTDGQLTFPITGLPLESARQITAGPGGTLWVTLTKNEAKGVEPAVVRISGVEPPPAPEPSGGDTSNGGGGNSSPPPVPETMLGKGKKVFKTKGKKANVKFRFSSSSTGATFECALRKKRKGKLTPIRYKGCKAAKAVQAGSREVRLPGPGGRGRRRRRLSRHARFKSRSHPLTRHAQASDFIPLTPDGCCWGGEEGCRPIPLGRHGVADLLDQSCAGARSSAGADPKGGRNIDQAGACFAGLESRRRRLALV